LTVKAALLAPLLRGLIRLVRRLLGGLENALRRTAGVGEDTSRASREAHWRQALQQSREAGALDESEEDILERVLRLGRWTAGDIMTPRTQLVWLNADEPVESVWRKMVNSQHDSYPVYAGTRDQFLGLVRVKAGFANLAAGLPLRLRDLVEVPMTVAENTHVTHLLEQFRSSGRHLAIVVDEFGQVIGLVTLIDVLEAMVGDLPSREERGRPRIARRTESSWVVDGAVEFERLAADVGLEPPAEDLPFVTVAGLILAQLDRVPQGGEGITWQGFRFEVLDVDGPRVDKVLVTRVQAVGVS